MMKKLFNILILFSLLLVINVKADSSGPMFPTVPAEVKNDNTKCYEYYDFKGQTITLNKGKIIDARYVDGKRYEYNSDDDEVGTCYIKAEDLIVGKQEYKLSREEKLSDPIDLMIVSDNGVEMYSGPLEEYSKLNMVIPKGTVLKTYYRIGTSWYYVTFNDVSGYITSVNRGIVYKESEAEYSKIKRYPIDDMDIKDASGKKVGTLPAITEISDYWYTDEYRECYITYNGISGFVDAFYTVAEDCTGSTLKVLSKVPVYKTIARGEGKTSTKIGTAEANKAYNPKYCFNGQGESGYYIPSLNGWLYFGYEDETDYIETDTEGHVYDTREARKRHVLEKIEVEGYNLYFQKNILSYRLEVAENVDKLNITVTPTEGVNVDITGNENLKNNSQIKIYVTDDDTSYTYTITVLKRSSIVPTVDPKKADSDNTILWLCLGGALLLVITTVVIIILVNVKRKSKDGIKEEIGEKEKTIDNSIEENTNETKL